MALNTPHSAHIRPLGIPQSTPKWMLNAFIFRDCKDDLVGFPLPRGATCRDCIFLAVKDCGLATLPNQCEKCLVSSTVDTYVYTVVKFALK